MFQKMREEVLSNVKSASALTPEMKLDFFKKVGYAPHVGQMPVHVHPAKYKVIKAGRRGGKALALDTPIVTPSGWSTMGEMKVGDIVYDIEGAPTPVVSVSPVMLNHECYRVCFSDGTTVTADADHLWVVEDRGKRRAGKKDEVRRDGTVRYRRGRGEQVLTTSQIAETLTVGTRGDIRYSIRCAKPIKTNRLKLPINPYILGVWLGDGHSANGYITCADGDILEEIQKRKVPVRFVHSFKTNGTASLYLIGADMFKDVANRRTLYTVLREAGLIGNKQIPHQYLRASEQQRLDLLRGLMDTDGYCDNRGHCEFTSTNINLAQGVKELFESLGQKATLSSGRATLYGKDCGARYRVHCFPTIRVFNVRRKAIRQKLDATMKRYDQHKRRFIVRVMPTETVPVKCITVDSPTSTYLVNDFIPTHNSYLATMEALAHAFLIPNSLIWIVGSSYDVASKIFTMCWRTIYWKMRIEKLAGCSEAEYRINLPNGSRIRGKTGENPDSLVGDGLDLVVIDEAQKLDEFIWPECLIPALSDKDGGALMIGSIEGDLNFLWNMWENANSSDTELSQDWKAFHFPSWDNTIAFPGGYNDPKLQRARRNISRDDFLEQFGAQPKRNPMAVLKEFDRRVHVEPMTFKPDYPVYLGIDPSGSVDPYAIVACQDVDHHLRFFDEYYESGMLTEDAKEDIAARPWFYKVKRAVCDDEAPDDIIRWCKQPKRVPTVGAHKADIAARVALYRKFLRDPATFNGLVRMHFKERTGLDEPIYMNPEHDELLLELEASISVDELKRCSRISIHTGCKNMIKEHASWAYQRPTKEKNVRDRPKSWLDHTTDAASYLVWSIFRYGKRRGAERYVDECV